MHTAVARVMQRVEREAYESRSGHEFRIPLSAEESTALLYHLRGFPTVREQAAALRIELLTQIWNLRGARPTSLKFRKK